MQDLAVAGLVVTIKNCADFDKNIDEEFIKFKGMAQFLKNIEEWVFCNYSEIQEDDYCTLSDCKQSWHFCRFYLLVETVGHAI